MVKLRSFSLLSLIFAILTTEGVSLKDESSIENYVKSIPEDVALFIESNFSRVVDEYNKVSEQSWEATYIENKFNILINVSGDQYNGVFLDFDKDNGYAVLGNDYQMLDFSVTGESPYANIQSDSYCYSTLSGYLYFSDGEYRNVDETKNYDFEPTDFPTCGSDTDNGQTGSDCGCGQIRYPDKYLKANHGEGWQLYGFKTLGMKHDDYTNQWTLSCYNVYEPNSNGFTCKSEGNCWVVSAYNFLQYIADSYCSYTFQSLRTDTSKKLMPKSSSIVTYDPKIQEPNIYNSYYDSDGNNISGKVTSSNGASHAEVVLRDNHTSFVFPELFSDIRKYVDEHYKHINDGNIWDTADIISHIGKEHGYNFNPFWTIAMGLHEFDGLDSVDDYKPFILCSSACSNSGYGNHLFTGCGYRIYTRTTSWWFFTNTEYHYFYEVRDGWNSDFIFFDITDWVGFGGIITI